jgi:hypothetical protein
MDPGVRAANALALVIRCSYIASDFVVLVLSEAVLSATVLVLAGCLNCGDADRGSRGFAVTCRPMGRIAILDRIEYEYEYRDAEYEYEKKHEQSVGPKCSIERF